MHVKYDMYTIKKTVCRFYLMFSWCNSLSGNSLLAAAEAGQCSQEQQQKQRDTDAQNQAQKKVLFHSIHLVSACKGSSQTKS